MAPRTRGVAKLEFASFYNSRGFAGLPLELLYHIVSYTREAVIPWVYVGAMEHWYSERRDLLRTLCQLCRSLRAIFFPLLWERIEACCTSTADDEKKPRSSRTAPSLANELLGQLKLVTDNKQRYAPYVRVVSVAVFPSQSNLADVILKKLARALSLMPNVHTVQIICPSPGYTPPPIRPNQFQQAFEGYIYPSVRQVGVPHQARSIFACFPQAQHVHMNQYALYGFSCTAAEVAKYCHAIESFGWKAPNDPWQCRVSLAMTMFPRLRRLECRITNGVLDDVMKLSEFQNLEQVTLNFAPYVMGREDTTEMIEAARGVLAKSQAPQKNKQLIVEYKSEDDSVLKSIYYVLCC